jgi:hypothetical protein
MDALRPDRLPGQRWPVTRIVMYAKVGDVSRIGPDLDVATYIHLQPDCLGGWGGSTYGELSSGFRNRKGASAGERRSRFRYITKRSHFRRWCGRSTVARHKNTQQPQRRRSPIRKGGPPTQHRPCTPGGSSCFHACPHCGMVNRSRELNPSCETGKPQHAVGAHGVKGIPSGGAAGVLFADTHRAMPQADDGKRRMRREHNKHPALRCRPERRKPERRVWSQTELRFRQPDDPRGTPGFAAPPRGGCAIVGLLSPQDSLCPAIGKQVDDPRLPDSSAAFRKRLRRAPAILAA